MSIKLAPQVLFPGMVVIVAVCLAAPVSAQDSKSDIERTLRNALLRQSDLPATVVGWTLKTENVTSDNFGRGNAKQEWWGHILVKPDPDSQYLPLEKDSFKIDIYLNYQDPSRISANDRNSGYLLSAESFRNELLKRAANALSKYDRTTTKAYPGLPGGVVGFRRINPAAKTTELDPCWSIQFLKSPGLSGKAWISSYATPATGYHKSCRQRAVQNDKIASTECERLAKLVWSRLPDGGRTNKHEVYFLECKTDKAVYETGERIFIKGSISKLVSADRRMSEGVKKAPLRLRVEFPQVKVKPSELNFIGDKIITDGVGEFSFAPFACAAEGNLTMTALLSTQDYPKLEKDITVKISVKIVPAPLPTDAQVEMLIKVFKMKVPSHQQEIRKTCTDLTYLKTTYGYGMFNNLNFKENGFHCYGYQVKTMRFLNEMRFSKIEDYSRLLRGLEYGPITRGKEGKTIFCGEHHAVALYRRNEDWKTAARVMDPWPMQKPEVFPIESFRRFYGSETFDLGRWNVRISPVWPRCVPMLQPDERIDGQVYWNLDIKQLDAIYSGYPEDPSEGLEKADLPAW